MLQISEHDLQGVLSPKRVLTQELWGIVLIKGSQDRDAEQRPLGRARGSQCLLAGNMNGRVASSVQGCGCWDMTDLRNHNQS